MAVFPYHLMVRAWLGCGWLLLWLWLPINQAGAEVLTLTQAEVRLTLRGLPESASAPVNLPYQWDSHQRGVAGEAYFQIPFSFAAAPSEPYGLYIPRLGNAYAIWLNGVLLEQHGDLSLGNGADFAKAPHYLALTPRLLRQDNLVQIHIRADAGRRGGLAPLVLGPHEEVYPRYLQDHRSRITGSFLVAVFGLLVGLVALAIWVTQVRASDQGRRQRDPQVGPTGQLRRQRDSLYLYAAVAELCWTVSVSDAFIETPPLPWPWWGILPVFTHSLWACSMTLFGIEIAGLSLSKSVMWLRRWLLILVLLVLAAAIGRALARPDAVPWAYGLAGLTTLAFATVFVWRAVRSGSGQHRLVAAAVVVNTVVGLRDFYVFQVLQAYGENTYLRYSSVLFGLTLAFLVALRFRAASRQVVELNASLARRVALKEAELARNYQGLAQGVQEQARSGERSRILRDMHDGVGSHISTAIRQLQSGRASGDEVLQTLRDSLDQLKLSIDAMHLSPGDITSLLANLRHRLEPRHALQGLQWVWAVDDLPLLLRSDAELEPVLRSQPAGTLPPPDLRAPATAARRRLARPMDSFALYQLQRMLVEALNNV
ncbi:MAG: histidine kinase, partial [Burkholderiales bacterium]|nr:histidine kinase [Burkholderiales bacterium]